MTADSQVALQAAVVAALKGAAGVTGLLSGGADGVRDHVPQGSGFPYLVVGEASSQAFDTKTEEGMEQTLTIHCWSRHRGMSEVKQIMAAVTDALDKASLTVAGHSLILVRFAFSTTLLDPDGLTRHGVQRFRVLTQGA